MYRRNAKEQRLIKACIRGDESAQRSLYEEHAGKMLAVCARFAPSLEDAEDILQEGFIKVFRSLDKYKHEGPLGGWIRRIMINTALEAIRKKGNWELHLMADEESYEALESDDDLAATIGANELIALMQRIPEGYREVLNLYAVEGYSHKEIAEMLSISVTNSKQRLLRARNIFRELMIASNTTLEEDERTKSFG